MGPKENRNERIPRAKLTFLFGFVLSCAIGIMKAFQPQTNPKYQFPGPIYNSLALFNTPNHTP
jgi:hypothetical protein